MASPNERHLSQPSRFAAAGRTCLAAVAAAATLLGSVVVTANALPPRGPPGSAYTTNAPVYAFAVAGGRTFLGGDFTRVGLRSGSGAVVSGSDGSRQAFPEVAGGEVRVVTSDGMGGWYIGGDFTHVGGERHIGLAHVNGDGSLDSGFAPVVTDAAGNAAVVNALVYARSPDPSAPRVDDGTLYVGGRFTRAGRGSGQVHTNLVALRGSDGEARKDWTPATSCSGVCSPDVTALTLTYMPLTVNGETKDLPVVFIGGQFSHAGPSDLPLNVRGLIAFWGVNAVDASGGRLEGPVTTGGTPDAWAPYVNAVNPPAIRDLQVSGSGANRAVYVGGSNAGAALLEAHRFAITTPTGRTAASPQKFSKWTPGPAGCTGGGCVPNVEALALKGSTVYFAGDFSSIKAPAPASTQVPAQRVAKIAEVPNPADTNAPTVAMTATALGSAAAPVRGIVASADGSRLFLAGEFPQGLMALDTSSGSSTGWDPAPDRSASAVATDGSTSFVYVGGRFTSLGSVPRAGLAAFDASGGLLDWAPGVASTNAAEPPLVRALAATDSTVYVGGHFDRALAPGGSPHRRLNLAGFDAASGAPTGFSSDVVRAGGASNVLSLALLGSTLYVGGSFDSVAAVPRQNLAAVDAGSGSPRSWNPAANGNVYALLPACGAVYAGGAFSQVAGKARRHLVALDPGSGTATAWNPEPFGDPDGTVFALARSGPTLFAGGNFVTIAGELRRKAAGLRIADGRATGFDPGGDGGAVRALAVSDSAVYAGGSFSTLGGAPSSGLAALDPATGAAMGWAPTLDGPVRALAVGDDALHAGGAFTTVGGIPQAGAAAFRAGAGSPFVDTACGGPAGAVGGAAPSVQPSPPAARPRERAPRTRISGLRVTPTRLRAGRSRLIVRFWASQAVRVQLLVQRRVRVRCPRSRVRRRARRICTRYRRYAHTTGRARRGRNRLVFPGPRIGRRRLIPGRYRLLVRLLPSASGRVLGAQFRVVR